MPYEGSISQSTPVYKNMNNEPIAPPKQNNNTLNMDSFLQLLAAQISHQDPLNPNANEDYMAQMAQMSMVQAMTDMMQMSMTSYAASMLGKTVTMAEVINGKVNKVEGVVTGVSVYNGSPILHVNGKDFTLDKLMVIGKLPEEKPEGGGTDKPDGPDTVVPDGGGTEKPEGPDTAEPDGSGTSKPDGSETTAPEGETTEKPEAVTPEGTDTEKPAV